MKKIIFVLLVLTVLGCVFWFLNYDSSPVPATLVSVHKGAVSVYSVDPKGEKEFLGTVREGQSLRATSRREGPFEMFNAMKKIAPRAMATFMAMVDQTVAEKTPGVRRRVFTESDLQKYYNNLMRGLGCSDGVISVDSYGMMMTGKFTGVPITVHWQLGTDKMNYGAPYLALNNVKVGGVVLPNFLVKKLSADATKVLGKGFYNVELIDIAYRDKSIDVEFRKLPTAQTFSPESYLPAKGLLSEAEEEDQVKVESIPSAEQERITQAVAMKQKGIQYVTIDKPGKGVFVKHRNGEWVPAEDGMVILEQDEIRTAPDVSVDILLDEGKAGRLEIKDGSLLKVLDLKTNFATGETNTLLNLAVGKLLAKVEPLTGNSSFSVRTPSAISGVRGTNFEVEIEEPSRKFPF